MQYRRFGKTNLQLSTFSLGTMRCLSSAANLRATLDRAIDLGLNHIETARGYGSSEEYLGQAFQQGLSVPRDRFHITSKLPPTRDAAQFRRWIDESLARLHLDYLDCLAIHGINTPEHLAAVLHPEGCLHAARAAVAAGKIRYLGFSTHAPLNLILETLNADLFDFVNLHYTYFFQRNAAAVRLAAAKDLGIFIISPADKGGKLYQPPPTLERLCQPLTPLALNARFLLVDPRITTLSVGPAHPEELLEPLASADATHPLTEEERAIFQRLEARLDAELGRDCCRQCDRCLPCPEAINIPEVLRLRNLAIAYEMTEFGQYRYRMFENAGHWFPGRRGDRCTDCGDCLPRCPEQLDIPKLLRDTHHRLQGTPRRRLWS